MKIGELLREARRSKGLTIGQAAKDLYIQEKYLQAIEEGNYEVIPGEVFLRAYFWKYVDYLGLKEQLEGIARPEELEPDRKEQSMDGIFNGEWDTARKTRVALKIGLPILIIVLIILGINMSNREPAPVAEPEQHTSTQEQHLEVVPGPSWEMPGNIGESASTEELMDNSHRITLTAIGQCWVTLKTREGTLYEGTMVAGDVQSHTDLVGFWLSAGAPEKLEVKFDGELIPWEPGQREMTLPPGANIFQEEPESTEENPESAPQPEEGGEEQPD
jgi:cytoskeleton protein RodZ